MSGCSQKRARTDYWLGESSTEAFMINRMSRRTALIKNTTLELAELCLNNPMRAVDLAKMNVQMADLLHLADHPATSGITEESPDAFSQATSPSREEVAAP